MQWPDELPGSANSRRWGWCGVFVILLLAIWIPFSSVYDRQSHIADVNHMRAHYHLVNSLTTSTALDLPNNDVGTYVTYDTNQSALLDLGVYYSSSEFTTTAVKPDIHLQVYIGPDNVAHFNEPNIKWNALYGWLIAVGTILSIPIGILMGHLFYKFCFMISHREKHKRRKKREAELAARVEAETKAKLMVDNPDLYKQSLLELVNTYDVTPGEAKVQEFKRGS